MNDDMPPPALQAAVDTLARRLDRRLTLVAAARWRTWCVLGFRADGTAQLVVPAMEAADLYRHLTSLHAAPTD